MVQYSRNLNPQTWVGNLFPALENVMLVFLLLCMQANTQPRRWWAGASCGSFSLAWPWLEQERMPCTNTGCG